MGGLPCDFTPIFQQPEYEAWNTLHNNKSNVEHLGLVMPRFLGRLPYGAKTNPVEEFAFEEDFENSHPDRSYCWVNAAFALIGNIISNHTSEKNTAKPKELLINSNKINNLPEIWEDSDNDSTTKKRSTEVFIANDCSDGLIKSGFIPLLHTHEAS